MSCSDVFRSSSGAFNDAQLTDFGPHNDWLREWTNACVAVHPGFDLVLRVLVQVHDEVNGLQPAAHVNLAERSGRVAGSVMQRIANDRVGRWLEAREDGGVQSTRE